MTVKELIEVLQACNQDAIVLVQDDSSLFDVRDSQVFHYPELNQVIVDLTYGEEQ